jgi:hypothetical protein
MANKESTAVNALIDLAQARPIGNESGPAEGLFNAPRPAQAPAPLPRLRAPGGTSQLKLPDVPASRVRMVTAPPSRGETIPPLKQRATTTLPPPRPSGTLPPPPRPTGTPRPTITKPPAPIAAPVAVAPAPSAPIASPAPVVTKPPVPAPWSPPPVPKPVQQPPSRPIQANPFASMPGLPPSRVDRTGDFVNAESWFESSRAVEKFDEETFVGTAPVVRLERRRKMAVLKIVATSVVFVVIGVVIGSYIAFSSDSSHPAKSKTPAIASTPAPTTPTIVQALPAQPATPAPAAKLADIRVDSTPSGATVMLVDNGKTSLLGTTPIATSLDPSRSYDVIVTVEGRPSKMAHLDPATAPHLEVALDAAPVPDARVAAAKPVAPPPVAVPAPAARHHHVAAARTAPIGQIADPGFDGPSTSAPSAGGNGTLMISSKPPCEIVIDGKATGLSTPQRALPLTAGAHKITFVNAGEHINKTVAVSITADQTTKLVKDLLN